MGEFLGDVDRVVKEPPRRGALASTLKDLSRTSRYVPGSPLRSSTGSDRSSPEVPGSPVLPQPQPGAGDPVNREVSHSCTS